jgi:glycosyltransferase involved in cell wall biosynthesis
MSPVRVRAFYTNFPHMGAHSGYRQLLRHIDPSAVHAALHPVTDGDEDWPLPETGLNERLRRKGVERGMAWYKLSDLAAELRALPACLTNAIDVVHYLDAEHTGQFLQGWIRRSRVSRVKTIGTFHQPPELLRELINPDAVRQLDLAVVVSPTQVPLLQEFLPSGRVRVLLHGADTAFFHPRAHRDDDRLFRCMTAGHWLRDWPAIRGVASLLSGQSDIEFHIVTNRETGLGDLPNVRIHRDIDDESLRSLYQSADVLFLPLTNATANNCLMEGLASGLPVISSRLPSIMAYVDDDSACLIADNEPEALAGAIVQLREDSARRQAMSRAARARAESLAWPRVSRQMQELYHAVSTRASALGL